MGMRSVIVGSLAALLVALGGGCGKSKPGEETAGRPPSTASPQPAAEMAGRLHWIGMKRLAAGTNAASFMRVWNLPETAKLEAQTLDKLALWLVASNRISVISNQSPVTNYQSLVANHPTAALLRPLLGDLVQEECYLEIRSATNRFGELALAIRLEDPRSRRWQTNLATALESLTGTRPTPGTNGWTAQVQSPMSNVQSRGSVVSGQWSVVDGQLSVRFTRSGEWTIFGLHSSTVTNQPALVTNLLVADFAARIQRNQTPDLAANQSRAMDPATSGVHAAPGDAARSLWLEAAVDLQPLADLLSPAARPSAATNRQSLGWPRVALAVTGDGTNVLTSGRLNFPEAAAFGAGAVEHPHQPDP